MTPEDVMHEVEMLTRRLTDEVGQLERQLSNAQAEITRLKDELRAKPDRYEVETIRHDVSNHIGSMTPHRFGQ